VKSDPVKIALSILSADYAHLGDAVTEATSAGADYIHIDIMDGRYVPPITIGAQTVAALRPLTDLPLDVHLMVEAPERQIDQFAKAGSDIITIHPEACTHVHRTIQHIKNLGIKAGVALNPGTSTTVLEEVMSEVDLILVMTVNPGYGGQKFIESMCGKIKRVRTELDRHNLVTELEVDGGINADNAARVVAAGARVLVAGAAVFATELSVKESLQKIRVSLLK